MIKKTLLYILVSALLIPLSSCNEILNSNRNSINSQLSLNNNNIVAMVNDYTLVNKVSEPINDNTNIFSLNGFKEREIKDNEKKRSNKENVLNKWFLYFKENFESNIFLEPFEQRVQTNVDSLNRLIINASDGLLNMCDKMIAKTTSSLPLSYSSYARFETEMRSTNFEAERNVDAESSGLFGLFSSSKRNAVVLSKRDLTNAELTKEVVQQMYDYQVYRLALNNRQTFLNGLCFNTFGSPYTLYYNSDNNTLSVIYNPDILHFYTIIVQNIVDNGFVRNLNRGFKNQQSKDKSKKTDFNFDVEFDIDKDKKEILVEKAKYILPILQRLEQRLPNYLIDIAKRSLTVDEYFQNLRQFWTEILDETVIAAHDTPVKYKLELEVLRLKEATEIQKRLETEKAEKEKMLKAEQEAQHIKNEYKKKALIDEARDFVRHSELLFKERQQNFSNQEWQQFNAWFSHQMSKGVNIYDSVLGGLGQMLHSTLNIPVNVVLNFASTQVSEIGKLLILVAGVVIVGLMTLFFVKLFIRRFVRLFLNTEKV